MRGTRDRRLALITTGAVTALLLPLGGVAIASQNTGPAAPAPATLTTAPEPTSTWTTPTDPTTTSPTDPTTTTTLPPPGCTDPGPEEFPEVPPGEDPSVQPGGEGEVNDYLKDVGSRILDLVDAGGHAGYAGMVADLETATMTLYWLAGEPLPPDIEQVVPDPGAPVTVVRQDAAYARIHLRSVTSALLNDPWLSDQICGFLHTIKPREEGSGLVAGVEPYDASFDIVTAQDVLSSAAGLPVTIEVGPQPTETTRLNDAAPWFAGAKITDLRGECSTSFGVVDGLRQEYMLSASHCFGLGVRVLNGNGTRVLGNVTHLRREHDSEMIGVTQAGNRTYFGGVGGAGAAEYDLQVNRRANNVVGTIVCTSGAATGENCGLQIIVTGVGWVIRRWVFDPRLGWVLVRIPVMEDMVDATSIRPRRPVTRAVGSGDSGGPAVTDSVRPEALGIMSAGLGRPIGCGPFRAANRFCFHTVRYVDLGAVLRWYGVALKG